MLVTVALLSGKRWEIEVEADDTIDKVKARIEEKEGIIPYQQSLLFGEVPLDGGRRRLSDYGVQHKALLTLAKLTRIRVYVKPPAYSGFYMGINAEPTDTVFSLKEKLELAIEDDDDQEDVIARYLEMRFVEQGSRPLKNDRTLESYGITHNSRVRTWTVSGILQNQIANKERKQT